MPVNLPLTILDTSAHKNGIVGYDSDKIYENYPANHGKNGDRVKSIFDTTSFIDIPVSAIAGNQHTHKSELDKFGDQNILDARILDIRTNEIGPLEEAKRNISATDPNRQTLELSYEAQILALESKITKINEQYSQGFLLDTTIENATDASGSDLGFEEGSDSAYNPDFPVETMSYAYNKDIYGNSQRGEDVDGVVAGTKAPNVAYPNDESSTYKAPKAGSGGFGVHPTKNSLNEGVLTSLQVTKRY